jgi:hypothetical protein
MSIHISDANSTLNDTGTRLNLPSGAGAKAGNIPALFGMWVQTPKGTFFENRNHVVMAKMIGAATASSGCIRFPKAATSAVFALWNSGSSLLSGSTVTLTGLTPGVPLLVMIAINPTHTHLIACHVGGTPVVISQAVTAPYTADMSTNHLISSFGGGSGGATNAWNGPIEEAFMLTGTTGVDLFPQTAGVPDATLIQNIANGAQDLDTLHTLLSGTRRFRYRMLHNRDLEDAWGVSGNLTIINEDKPAGKQNVNGRTLRPAQINPAPSIGGVSQCTFPIAGDASRATCKIKVPGGTYSGLTPAAVQARLVNEAGTSVVDWTTIDAAPAAGVWVAGELTNVPMTAGWLFMDIRLINGSSAQIGPIVSAMTSGAGFRLVIGSGQSQFAITENGGSLAIPSGIRVLHNYRGERFVFLGSADKTSRQIGVGFRRLAMEINERFPGIPIELTTILQAGEGITSFATGGAYAYLWAQTAASQAVQQPFIWMLCGHSSGANSFYQTYFEDMLAQGQAVFGEPLIYCLMPVPRYSLAGTNPATGSASQTSWSRRAMRAWHEENREISYWGGSLSVVRTSEDVSSDPHPDLTDYGSGRTGAIMGWRAMEAIRAITSEVIGLTGAAFSGNDVLLTFGRVSDYPSPQA